MQKLFSILLAACFMMPMMAQSPDEDSWQTDYELMKSDGWKALNKGMSLKTECQLMHDYSAGSLGDDRQYCYGGAQAKNKSRKEAARQTIYQAQKDLAEFLIFAYASGREDLHASTQVRTDKIGGRASFTTVDKKHGIEITFKDGNEENGYKAVYTFHVMSKPLPQEIPSLSFGDAMEQLIERLQEDVVVLSFYRKVGGLTQVQSLAYGNIEKDIDDICDLIANHWAPDGAVQIILQGEKKR